MSTKVGSRLNSDNLIDFLSPYVQRINLTTKHDGRIFNCINRGDENPFDAATPGNKSKSSDQEKWLKNVKTCKHERRQCIGHRADLCAEGILISDLAQLYTLTSVASQ